MRLDEVLRDRRLLGDARRGTVRLGTPPHRVEDRGEIRQVLAERVRLGPAAADLVDLPVALALFAHREPRVPRDVVHRMPERPGQQRDRGLAVVGHRQRPLRDDAAAEHEGYQREDSLHED